MPIPSDWTRPTPNPSLPPPPPEHAHYRVDAFFQWLSTQPEALEVDDDDDLVVCETFAALARANGFDLSAREIYENTLPNPQYGDDIELSDADLELVSGGFFPPSCTAAFCPAP
jgi:hypothetical protein